ncbi:MAG: right-handed parallel beta-helix repeat-containing protein [Clostridia bacterium]|nr:right-handed parallel beta-helix repeat-containing protein [Clostridia bacterium]
MSHIYYVENTDSALPDALGAGDTLLFRRGRTFSGIHLHVTADDVCIGAYGSGGRPVLQDPSADLPAILLEGNGCRISQIEINGYLLGIAAVHGRVERTVISDCCIRNITTGKYFPELPSLPLGAPLSFGVWLCGVRDVRIESTTFENTDSPMQLCGSRILLDGLLITDSHIQGIMLYGARDISKLEEVLALEGDMLVRNCRIFHTGDRAAFFGSTGILIENTVNCTVRDSEIAYTVNTLGAYDSCAVDWEQNNVNCVFDGVYAHDNQGPFVLAMEHPESLGNSRGNVIRNCLSVHNGLHGTGECGTFIHHSSYRNPEQTIRIENCSDYGTPGSVPYRYEYEGEITYADDIGKAERLSVTGFTSGTASVCTYFETEDPVPGISIDGAYVWCCGGITMPDGGKITVGNGNRAGLLYVTVRGTVTVKTDGADDIYGKTGEWTHIELKTTERDADVILSLEKGAVVSEIALYPLENRVRSFDDYNHVPAGDRLECNTANGRFAFMSPETEWTAEGVVEWVYRPFFAGTAILDGHDASVTRTVGLPVRTGRVGVVCMNGTDTGEILFGFEKDGVWTDVPFTTVYSDPDLPTYAYFSSRHPAFRLYTLELSSVPAYTGTVRAVRLRIRNAHGIFAVKSVILNLS